MEIDTEDYIKVCPVCKTESWMTISDDLQKHDLKSGEAYRLIHCDKCCTYFKEVWKFQTLVQLTELQEIKKE